MHHLAHRIASTGLALCCVYPPATPGRQSSGSIPKQPLSIHMSTQALTLAFGGMIHPFHLESKSAQSEKWSIQDVPIFTPFGWIQWALPGLPAGALWLMAVGSDRSLRTHQPGREGKPRARAAKPDEALLEELLRKHEAFLDSMLAELKARGFTSLYLSDLSRLITESDVLRPIAEDLRRTRTRHRITKPAASSTRDDMSTNPNALKDEIDDVIRSVFMQWARRPGARKKPSIAGSTSSEIHAPTDKASLSLRPRAPAILGRAT